MAARPARPYDAGMRLRGLTLRSSVVVALAGLLVVVLGRLILDGVAGQPGGWAAVARVAGIGLTAAGALTCVAGLLCSMVHGAGYLAGAVGIVVNVFARGAGRRR